MVALHGKAISLPRLCFNIVIVEASLLVFAETKLMMYILILIKLFSLMTCLKNGAETNFVLCTMYFSLQQDLCTFTN